MAKRFSDRKAYNHWYYMANRERIKARLKKKRETKITENVKIEIKTIILTF